MNYTQKQIQLQQNHNYYTQVHERQAARMRTRSEWFLGPKDDDILCVDDIIQIPANTCSNCYLQQHQQQQHQQQQNQHEHEYPVGYLGGGSTRDMRHSERSAVSNVSSPMQDQTAGVLNNTTFLYYKQPTSQQPHQHQQHQLQRQSFHLAPEHMDTDEECFQGASASLHSMQQPKAARKIPTTNTVSSSGCADVAVRDGGCPAMLLDNNYGRYNFVDDKNLKNSTSTFTNTTTTITTTTTTTTTNTTITTDIHNKENNNNNIANNNSNNNNNNKSNSNYYTSNNRHHMTKISLNKCHSMELMHQQLQQLQEQEQEQQTATTTHLQHLQHYEHKPTNHHMHANHNIANHYYSIEPLLKANRKNKESIQYHDEDQKRNEGEEGVFYIASSKLSYHSPRQDDNSCSFINNKVNPNIANTNTTANPNVTTATRLSNPIANCNDALINGEIDYEFTSRFRHSTPIMQRRRLRQQQALIRQRSPSQSSSLYQSFNASLQAPMTTASAGRYSNVQQRLDLNNSTRRSVNGDSGGGTGGSVGNSNFLGLIFNVLDFLF
uniref:Uncharacterized protein n=1 Tax=Glossina palpalis gambiensis TaxID=67801 RepID=A0A1B0AQV8_9MUSC